MKPIDEEKEAAASVVLAGQIETMLDKSTLPAVMKVYAITDVMIRMSGGEKYAKAVFLEVLALRKRWRHAERTVQ